MDFIRNKKKISKSDESESDCEEICDYNIRTSGNEIYFYENIGKEEILELIDQIKKLSHDLLYKSIIFDFEPHIKLHIYSDGGDAYMGLSIYNFIKNNKVPIWTYIDGYIASAATFMYLAWKKRFMDETSNVLIHQVSTSFWGKFEDLKDECQNTTNLMQIVRKLYTDNSSMSEKQLKKLIKREQFLTYDDCKKIKLFTE